MTDHEAPDPAGRPVRRHVGADLLVDDLASGRPGHGTHDPESTILGASTESYPGRMSSRRDVNHLLHIFSSFGFGGVPIRMSGIINHFGARYRHTILALDSCLDSRVRINAHIDVDFQTAQTSKYGLLSNVMQFRGFMKNLSPDLLLTYNWGAVEWCFANAFAPICPNVHLESGFHPEEADGQLKRRVLFRRLALVRTWRIVVPSQTLVNIATGTWKLPESKVVHIPNGVDLDRFSMATPAPIAGMTSAPPNDLIVGTLAPLRAEKNIARLIRVFSRLRNATAVRLMIVGDGVERPRLEQLADDLEIRDKVIFTGHLEEVERVLPWFDIFALSSDTEQMPNSLNQAMAAGLPVAAVDVGDVKHMLANENREFVVGKNDESGFVEVLERLLDDERLRDRVGRLNQDRVRGLFTQQRMFDAYAEIFEGPK